MNRLLRLSVVAVLVALVVPGVAHADPADQWRYTLVAFSNGSARDMDVYTSADGTDFDLLEKAAFRPASGYVRDPSIIKHSDGQYYVTYTTADGTDIGFARSSDLHTWEELPRLWLPLCCAFLPGTGDGKGPAAPLGITGSAGFKGGPSLSPFTTKVWAPEWFVDGDRVHVIVSMSTGGGFVPYLITARDASLSRWTWPVPIGGIGADHIDTTIVKVDDEYHAFTKNETRKVIAHLVAPDVGGPYAEVAGGDWGTLVEGPAVTALPNGDWRLYLDAYTEKKYVYSDSSDGMETWSKPVELPGLSGTARHFGVLREAAE